MKYRASFLGAMIILLTAFGGCASSGGVTVMRIDGSSQQATSNSLKLMSESLSSHERCLLQAAILRIQLGDASMWKAGNAEHNEQANPLGSLISGMTFKQIIELSQRYPDKAGNSCTN